MIEVESVFHKEHLADRRRALFSYSRQGTPHARWEIPQSLKTIFTNTSSVDCVLVLGCPQEF